MIKIEFPADRTDIAAAIGRALLEIGGVALNHSVRERIGDVEVETVTTTQCLPEGPKNCRCAQVTVSGSDVKATQPGDLYAVLQEDIETAATTQSVTDSDDAGTPKNRIIPHDEIEADLRGLQAAADLIPVSQGGTMLDGAIQPGDKVSFETNSGEVITGTATDAAGALPQADGKGVAFHAAFCGISAKPFYETGKTSGQWKKRRGVDQAAYDAWYAAQLQVGAAPDDVATVDTAPVDTAGAFGTTDTQPTEPEHTHAPTTCGDFMGWASAKQAAGLLTQADITEAYAVAGLVITDLFPPNDDVTIAGLVAQLHDILSAKAGA